GSVTVTDPYTMTYSYYGEDMDPSEIKAQKVRNIGLMKMAVSSPIHSTTTDAFGNVSTNTTEQTFAIIAGQAKLVESKVTESTSLSIDGSETTLDKPYSTYYGYDAKTGLLKAVGGQKDSSGNVINGSAVRIQTTALDSFGNKTFTTTDQVFSIVAGQAKMKTVETSSRAESIDGSVTVTDPYTMTYSYYGEDMDPSEIKADVMANRLAGRKPTIGHLVDVSDPTIFSTTTDSFGNVTYTMSLQVYTVHKGTGTSKLSSITTTSLSISVDGSETVTNPYTTYYDYDATGQLLRAYISQPIAANALGTASALIDRLNNLGFSASELPGLMDLAGQVTQATAVNGTLVISIQTDQGIFEGTVKLSPNRQINPDGSYVETVSVVLERGPGFQSSENLTVSYTYDASGNIKSISGIGNKHWVDEDGNLQLSFTYSTYSLFGKTLRKIEDNIVSGSISPGFYTVTDPVTIQYSYTSTGELKNSMVQKQYTAPSGESYPIHSTTTDAFGNVTESWSNQTFSIVAGQAKMKTSTTESQSISIDGAISITDPYTVTYSYRGENMTPAEIKAAAQQERNIGHLTGATSTSIHSTTTDAFGNVTTTTTQQFFKPILGQAKLVESKVTESTSMSIDGSVSTLDAPYSTFYGYNAQTGLLSAVGGKLDTSGNVVHGSPIQMVSSTLDAFGSRTITTTTQVFTIIAGQAKIKTAETSSRLESIDGSITITAPYATVYSYDETNKGHIGHITNVTMGKMVSTTTDAFG
ncbi:MAG TPA: hypothetical protein PK876_10955, partial [Elusimicrobiota bacterium]|nr:hypothetical protein [Elusimicrobiota bacterium]